MRKRIGVICLSVLACILLFAGCGRKIASENAEILCRLFTEKGYAAEQVDDEYGLLTQLGSEVEKALETALQGGLAGYVYAFDESKDALAAEVFIFEKTADAKKMYNYFDGKSQFKKGESEVRISGKVVYMGYIKALDAIES